MKKIQIWDPESGIKILGQISESLVSTFWVKNTLILCCGTGSTPGIGIGMGKNPYLGSGILNKHLDHISESLVLNFG
jgi:hypothetical protein